MTTLFSSSSSFGVHHLCLFPAPSKSPDLPSISDFVYMSIVVRIEFEGTAAGEKGE